MLPSLNLQVILIENLIYIWSGSPVQGTHLSSPLVLLSLTLLSALEDYQRMVEIFGNETSGKTTLALHIVKEAQKNGDIFAKSSLSRDTSTANNSNGLPRIEEVVIYLY